MNTVTTNTPAFVRWIKGCQITVNKHYHEDLQPLEAPDLRIVDGKKYIKIVKEDSVWAFINKQNGDVLKPAGWRTPAKHARGNIFDDQNGLSSIGPYGPAYLR